MQAGASARDWACGGAGLRKRIECIMDNGRGASAGRRAVTLSFAASLLVVTVACGPFIRASVFAEGRPRMWLAAYPYNLPPRQDPSAKNRIRRLPRVEPNTPAPELYSDKLALQLMLVNLPGASDAASYWEGSYQLFFVSEAEERRVVEEKYRQLAPKGGPVAVDIQPSEYKEKILLAEGKFKQAGLATLHDRTFRAENVAFKARVPEALRTKGGHLLTVYSVRIFDARLKMTLYKAGQWMARVFDEDVGGEKPSERAIVYANFFVSLQGDVFTSQWARDNTKTDW
jgi:hypothetical protein